jgi:pilus assembly protein CpaE
MTASSVKTLIALDDGIDAAVVEASLPVGGPMHVVGMGEGIDQSWSLLEETSPDLVVVAAADYSQRALYLIDAAYRQRPERPIVVLYSGTPNGFMERAFEAGADDLIVLPQPAEHIRFAFEKALARRRGAVVSDAQAPLLVVLGPKGGTGKTLTACNMAVSFARQGRRTALVDLDLQFGDVGVALGLRPDRTLYDLACAGGTLDVDKVEGYLTEHEASGLRVLLAPTRPDQATFVGVEFLRELYRLLRSSSDVIVVDTPPAFSPEVIGTIDSASHLCLVGMLDALSLKDSKLGLETLELMGVDSSSVKLVLNRATASSGISRDDAQMILGRTPDAFVPEDREIPRTLTAGVPIVLSHGRSATAKAFEGFAAAYLGEFDAALMTREPDASGKPAAGAKAAGRRLLRAGRR